jgi:hypothetical protein
MSRAWAALLRAWTATILAREAADERTPARAHSAITNSTEVGCRPVSEKADVICAATDTRWAWAASRWDWASAIRATATTEELTADVPFSPFAIPVAVVAAALSAAAAALSVAAAALSEVAAAFKHVESALMADAAALGPESVAEVALTMGIHVPIFHRRRLKSKMVSGVSAVNWPAVYCSRRSFRPKPCITRIGPRYFVLHHTRFMNVNCL